MNVEEELTTGGASLIEASHSECAIKMNMEGKLPKRPYQHMDFFAMMEGAATKRARGGECSQASTSSSSDGTSALGRPSHSSQSSLATAIGRLRTESMSEERATTNVGAVFMAGGDDDEGEEEEKEEPKTPTVIDHRQNKVYASTLDDDMRRFVKSNEASSYEQVLGLRMASIADHVHASLSLYGWAIVDHLMGQTQCKAFNQEARTMYANERFIDGQLVNDRSQGHMSDHVFWFDNRDGKMRNYKNTRLLIGVIDAITTHLTHKFERTIEISGRSKALMSVYPRGGRYNRHVDNATDDGRCITACYYSDWAKSDGGVLRLFPSSSNMPIDVDPKADRLLMHWSDGRVPHQRMPIINQQFSLTIWYFDKHQKQEAMKRAKSDATLGRQRLETDRTWQSTGAMDSLRELHSRMGGPLKHASSSTSAFTPTPSIEMLLHAANPSPSTLLHAANPSAPSTLPANLLLSQLLTHMNSVSSPAADLQRRLNEQITADSNTLLIQQQLIAHALQRLHKP